MGDDERNFSSVDGFEDVSLLVCSTLWMRNVVEYHNEVKKHFGETALVELPRMIVAGIMVP